MTVFRRLGEDFGEYHTYAEKEDQEFKNFSPFLNPKTRDTGVVEFDIKQEIPKLSGPGYMKSLLLPKKKITGSKLLVASKWALFQGDRLRRLLHKFQKRNRMLQGVLPLAIAASLQRIGQNESEMEVTIKKLVGDADAQRLGLAKHAQIRGLIQMDRDPQQNLHLTHATVESDTEQNFVHCGTCITTKGKGNVVRESVLVEYKYYIPPSEGLKRDLVDNHSPDIPRNVSQLGSLLYSSGANNSGTLDFKGYLDQPAKGRYAFVFHFPQKINKAAGPTTLHTIIEKTSSPWVLDVRFRTAQFLAKTLAMLHIDKWLHKNISSHSLVFFEAKEDKKWMDSKPYLVDFEYSRPDYGSTLRLYDGIYEKDVYRHPEIQSISRPSFSRLHDIYSLGVVLLEIAVWSTAQKMVEDGISDPQHHTPQNVKDLYVKVAKRKVPHRMGAAYLESVLACLSSDLEDQFSRADFPVIFQREVVDKLSPKLLIAKDEIVS